MHKIQPSLLGILAVLALPLVVLALNTITTGFQVGSSQVTIDAHGTCKKVSATDGKSYFVPTNTASEWSAFRNNKPAEISLASCYTCNGAQIGGHCFYIAPAKSQSCDSVCAAQGSVCSIAGTRDYVGSGGANANCRTVLNALNTPYTYVVSDSSGSDVGCSITGLQNNERRRYVNESTNCTAVSSLVHRVCACAEISSVTDLQNMTWENLGQILPGHLANSQSFVTGGYVYLFGGRTSTTGVTSAIYRASVSSPASWASAGNLPGPVHSGQLYSDGTYLYMFGGRSGETAGDSTYLNTIYRASVSNPQSWSNTGYILPSKLAYSQLVVPGDGYIYLLGGSASYQTYNNVIYRAPVSDPLSWTNTGATLPTTLGTSQAYVYGGYIYLFGGRTANNVYTSTIYRAPTSNPLSWSAAGTLPFSMAFGTVEPIGDSLYFFGGYNGSSLTSVYKAPLSNLLSWSLVSGNLPGGFDSTQAEIIGGHVYLISGGSNTAWATKYVYRARIR